MLMNIQVITDEKNPLFKRREITLKLGYEDKTPSRLEVRKEVAKNLGAKEELVVIKRVIPDYGTPAAKCEINVYDDEKSLKELETGYLVKRHLPKEKKEPKEAEDDKKEEVKEEKKEADKPEEKPKEEEKKEEKKPGAPKEEEKKGEPKEEKKEEKK